MGGGLLPDNITKHVGTIARKYKYTFRNIFQSFKLSFVCVPSGLVKYEVDAEFICKLHCMYLTLTNNEDCL